MPLSHKIRCDSGLSLPHTNISCIKDQDIIYHCYLICSSKNWSWRGYLKEQDCLQHRYLCLQSTWEVVAIHESQLSEKKLYSHITPSFIRQFSLQVPIIFVKSMSQTCHHHHENQSIPFNTHSTIPALWTSVCVSREFSLHLYLESRKF